MGVIRYVPNIITFVRIPLTFLLLCSIIQDEYMSAAFVFAAICLTDISDGIAARMIGACTRFGAYMDVAVDLFYVMASLIVLNMKGLAPVWFTAVSAFKFIEFAVTSYLLKKDNGNISIWAFDGLGRCFSALAFLSPGVFCLDILFPGGAEHFQYFFPILASAIAVASTNVRVARCVKSVKSRRCIDNE